jgi:aromatic-L-amino-acid decarboxylase
LSVKLFGAAAFRAALAEKRALALEAFRRVAALPHIVVDAPPDLSLFAFHLSWPGATLDDEDRATKILMDRATARGRVMLSGSHTHGRFLGRVCVLSFRTHARQIDALVEDIASSIAEIVPDATSVPSGGATAR